MDEKHAMLYPPLEGSATAMPHDPYAAGGSSTVTRPALPTEAPPTYDVAMSHAGRDSIISSASGWIGASGAIGAAKDQQQHHHHHQPPYDDRRLAMEAIVEQPQSPQVSQPHSPPVVPTPPKLGPNPCAVICPACGSCKTTRMCYTPNSRTHLVALLLCLVGWCCCACCVPYCMNSCRTGNHYCSKCNTFLGAYNPRTDNN